jgi:transposase
MTCRYALRDDQWQRIKDLLPGQEGYVGVTARDNRLFVEAVLYLYRAGIPWRDLPARFGDFRVIHTRYAFGTLREQPLVKNRGMGASLWTLGRQGRQRIRHH